MFVYEKQRIETLNKMLECVNNGDIRAEGEYAKEEGYLLWQLQKAIEQLIEFYNKEK